MKRRPTGDGSRAKELWDHPFEPTGYELDWAVLTALPLAVRSGSDTLRMTVGEVVQQLLPDWRTNPSAARRLTIASSDVSLDTTLSTPDTTIHLTNGTAFAAAVVSAVLELLSQGIQTPIFFFYDEDHVTDELQFSYSFFVADRDRIARDRITLFGTADNGFVAEVFRDTFRDDKPIWSANNAILEAQLRHWYRKFYEETDAGRLTALRDDISLYHFVPARRIHAELTQRVSHLARELRIIRWFVTGCMIALVLSLLHLF